MKEEVLEMTEKERDRLVILKRVSAGDLTQVEASKLLGVSDRQIRNLLRNLADYGDRGILSKRRGKEGNHRLPETIKQKALSVLSTQLSGFGPTLAAEKLEELWKIVLSKETVRQWMIESGLWQTKQKKIKQHKLRPRRACFGELIQVDGSHHRWFGPEHEMANLTVFIDDATGKLTALHFSETETLDAYFVAFNQHLGRYGRPRAIYTDRSAIAEVRQGDSITQFQRALNQLDTELILANSAQAKGRVERANLTLQDRLVKELQLRGIKTIEEANRYLPEFMETHNKKFSRVPANDVDAHRSLEGYDLSVILRVLEVRTLSKAGTFQYQNEHYEVKGLATTRSHKGRKVHIYCSEGLEPIFCIEGTRHKVVRCADRNEITRPEVKGHKAMLLWKPKPSKPAKNHPWRHWINTDKMIAEAEHF